MKTTYAILFTLLIVIGFQGCGVMDSAHKDLNCVFMGKDCKVRSGEFNRYQEEQDVRLDGIDAQIGELVEILGVDRLDVQEVINLCDNNEEILVRIDGELIAFHSSRNGGYLDILGPGNYITTDGKSCRFNVTQDLEVVYP